MNSVFPPSSTADVAPDGSELKAAASHSAHRISEAAAAEAARVGEAARNWFRHQSEVAANTVCALRNEASALAGRSQRYVRDEPVKSVLVAVAAGALITAILVAMRGRH